MLFESAYTDFQILVRSESITYHPATGVEIGRVPPLTANFGKHLGEFEQPDYLTGGTHMSAAIQGNFCDTEMEQQEKGWSDEERESVEAALLKLAAQQPYVVAQIILEPVVAVRPWPSYDDQTAKEIVALAQSTGLLNQAVAYERENKNRSTLVAELEQLIAATVKHEPEMAEITL